MRTATASIKGRGALLDTDIAEYRRTFDTNVMGTFLALRWAARQASDNPSPLRSVVTMCSAVTAKTVTNQALYNASKSAVAALTRTAARELAPQGVRVNAVAPGSVLTPMTADGWADSDHARRMRTEIPLGRPGTPDEIAAVTAFLLLPQTPTTVIIFACVMGVLWLSTVPPTNALVAVMFGTRYLGMLGGIVFFSHQIGSFLGVWLGGYLFDLYGSFDPVWWIGVALGIFAAIIHWPIKQAPVARMAAAE